MPMTSASRAIAWSATEAGVFSLPKYSTFICASRSTRATAIAPFSCWSIPITASAIVSRDIAVLPGPPRQGMIEHVGRHPECGAHSRGDLADRRRSVQRRDDGGDDICGACRRSGDCIETPEREGNVPLTLEALDLARMIAPVLDLGRRDVAQELIVLF